MQLALSLYIWIEVENLVDNYGIVFCFLQFLKSRRAK